MCLVNNGHCKGFVGAARIASLFLKLLPVATLRLDKIQDSQSISGQSNCAEQRYCAQSDYAHGGGHGEG